ncbi:MAG TPA: sulfatase-like hydrolase/transferase [Amaricoccus sp.]|uniref:sulfatase family protein n=1 Tax=Amaricoccus sp. TaxID=1872485 RepID=UPI002BBC2626|nr:sulfatase-like hydrolase/transferase [Amaricoccus sp.]HMQ91698.1 sulfatase-like hydrolase/transferase [Amaricoccus sp.]HMR52199.1 sulfatase-like hydrolase/transferase [Amaricoccus sp.]HMT99051.1 sulfatase-like hydrolase/transferase [Amaricoccus sp.]
MTDRPDFLVIMTDQHRWDWLGCNGHPVVRTPNIDRIAAHGTSFDQYFVASPVCMPNRASFMTGRFPTVHGLRYNGCHLPIEANTVVDVLRAGGYRTGAIGKSHLQPMIGRRVPARSDAGPIPEAWKVDESLYEEEQPSRYRGEDGYRIPLPYYGYDHIDMVTDHGTEAGGHYRQWLRRNYPQVAEDPMRGLPHNYTVPQALRPDMPEEAYTTSYIRDQAIEYLVDQAGSEQPLFTFVSFPDPHHPFNPPGRYWDMYSPDQFDLGTRYVDHKAPPVPLAKLREDYEAGTPPAARTFSFMAPERHLREAMALTAGMITMIDEAVGGILAALEASGRADRTVVIFTSDHGDYLGDSDLLLKGPWMRESINKVPLIWSDPSDPEQPARCAALTSTVDIAPSILQRAGLVPYNGMQGRSFLPVLGDETAERRSDVLVEYNDANERQGYRSPARIRTLVTEDWTLIVPAGEGWGELYDRKADPENIDNKWVDRDFADVRARLTDRLLDRVIAQMDESPKAVHPA